MSLPSSPDPFHLFRSHGVQVRVSCSVTSPPCPLPPLPFALPHPPLPSVTMTTVQCYGVSVPWYSRWGLTFMSSLSAPRVSKRQRLLTRALQSLRAHVRSVEISSLSVHGLEVQAYDSHPWDEARKGLRLAIQGAVSLKVRVGEEAGVPDPFATGRVIMPDSLRPFWAVQQVRSSLYMEMRRLPGHP